MLTVTLRTIPDSEGCTRVIMTRVPADPADPVVLGIHAEFDDALQQVLSIGQRVRQAIPEGIVSSSSRVEQRRDGRRSATIRYELDVIPGQGLFV